MKTKSSEQVNQIKEMAGIAIYEINNIIVDDLFELLSQKKQTLDEHQIKIIDAAFDGYILALSRILELKKGWTCITNVFNLINEKIPQKYYQVFNMPEEQ